MPIGRSIADFFRPYAASKSSVPASIPVELEDDIIVATQPSSSQQDGHAARQSQTTQSPTRQLSARRLSNTLSIRSSPKASRVAPPPSSVETVEDRRQNHASPAKELKPSSQRPLSAVVIPPPVTNHAHSVNASFSSISGLSNATFTSQSSSRRIIKGGIPAVTNSDSGSADGTDGTAEDSSEDLLDIDALVPRKRMRMTPPRMDTGTGSGLDTVRPVRHSDRLLGKTSMSASRDLPLPAVAPRRVYKHSLLKMVKATERKEKANERIAELEAEMLAAGQRALLWDSATRGTRNLAGIVTADDSDEGERMLQALGRTEALQDDQDFHAFRSSVIRVQRFKFPGDKLPQQPWAKALSDEASRSQACLTAFAAALAAKQLLPLAMMRWFAVEVVWEPRQDLRAAYVETVKAYAQSSAASVDETLTSLREFFNFSVPAPLFATPPSSDLSSTLTSLSNTPPDDEFSTKATPQHLTSSTKATPQHLTSSGLPLSLGEAATIVSHCAPLQGTEAVLTAVFDLAVISIDAEVQRDVDVLTTVVDAIDRMLDATSDQPLREVTCRLVGECSNTTSLSRLDLTRFVTALPSKSTSSHTLRRSLALHCLTRGAYAEDDLPFVSAEWHTRIVKHLKTSEEFAICDDTDYRLLTGLADLLDIAIDTGFSNLDSSPQFNESSDKAQTHGGPTQQERAFNASIDTVTTQLKLIISKIKDSGAAHLRRMEAKSALERVVSRLEFTVRTRPKPRKTVFGESLAEQRTFMQGFVKPFGAQQMIPNGAAEGGDVKHGTPEDGSNKLTAPVKAA